MLDQAHKLGQELPLLEIHAAVLEACVRHGESEKDGRDYVEGLKSAFRPI
jgi:hypothetical protein